LEPNERRKQDIYLSSLDFLDCSRMQPYHFSEPFLSDFLKHSFAADIIAEGFEL
jgi:hypothetical protein